jgi:hypothetical protein
MGRAQVSEPKSPKKENARLKSWREQRFISGMICPDPTIAALELDKLIASTTIRPDPTVLLLTFPCGQGGVDLESCGWV